MHETNWIDRNVIQVHHLLERMVSRGHTCEIIDYDMLWPTHVERGIWQPRQVFLDVNKVIPGIKLRVTRPGSLQIPLICHAIWAINSVFELLRLIREKRPDIILCCSLTNSYLIAILAKLKHIPFVYMIYEPYYTMVPQKWLRPIAKLVEKLAARTAERVFVFTPQMSHYAQKLGACSEQIEVFKSGVGQEIFAAGQNGANFRSQLGLSKYKWVIFFMGWLYDFSGLREIFNSIAEKPDLLNGAHLLVVGDGDLYHELENIVKQNKLTPQITMTGKRPYTDIPSLLGTANVCLMPALENDTTRDIVPMKVYEYLAAGKPVIASRLPGMVMEFGNNSGIVYSNSPIEALNKSLSLRLTPNLAERLSEEGRNFALKNANWEKTTDEFETILLSLLGITG
jgi:glycosyltransferase involved in cell wall biosynthesis